ncbi:MAG: TIGR04372 family glycosyltransferase [Paracoccaceae bacterium]|nr:TIGR04372 family glycosyltransferase [Paracoccaceae bacterium]
MNQALSQIKTISTHNEQWEEINAFGKQFNAHFQSGHTSKLIQFLESFSISYPLHRDLIKQAYIHCNQFGISSLANECARIYTETCSTLSKIGRTQFGLPTIFEFNYQNELDSELIEQAAFTKILLDLEMLTIKPVLCLNNLQKSPFLKAFSPYLEECVEIMSENPNAARALYEVSRFSPYVPMFYKFSETQYGHNANFIIDCHNDLVSKDIVFYPFTIKDITTEKAKSFLSSFGLLEKDEFVIFYLREEGYVEAGNSNKKIFYLEQFYDSINYFLRQGLKVVRLGHSKMSPMCKRPGFIDLTNVERPYEVDIFLCGKAQLYFGSGSGPISLARNFGIPCCEIARINYSGTNPNSFSQYLIFEDTKTQIELTFSDMNSLSLNSNLSLQPFLARNLNPRLPNSTDNLLFAKESMDYITKGKIFDLNKNHKSQRANFNIAGGVSSSSLPFLK